MTYQSIDDVILDAYRIAVDGASNPVAVAHSLGDMIDFMQSRGQPLNHFTLRAVLGHLEYLMGISSGPSISDLENLMQYGEMYE